jgi:hypothetical protein
VQLWAKPQPQAAMAVLVLSNLSPGTSNVTFTVQWSDLGIAGTYKVFLKKKRFVGMVFMTWFLTACVVFCGLSRFETSGPGATWAPSASRSTPTRSAATTRDSIC